MRVFRTRWSRCATAPWDGIWRGISLSTETCARRRQSAPREGILRARDRGQRLTVSVCAVSMPKLWRAGARKPRSARSMCLMSGQSKNSKRGTSQGHVMLPAGSSCSRQTPIWEPTGRGWFWSIRNSSGRKCPRAGFGNSAGKRCTSSIAGLMARRWRKAHAPLFFLGICPLLIWSLLWRRSGMSMQAPVSLI